MLRFASATFDLLLSVESYELLKVLKLIPIDICELQESLDDLGRIVLLALLELRVVGRTLKQPALHNVSQSPGNDWIWMHRQP